MEYKACGFFVSRTPLLPIENYFYVFGKPNDNETREKLFALFREPALEEALAVASVASHQALTRVNYTDHTKAADQLLSTLIKYYIRVTTRPTPYGLFSGVSIGAFRTKSEVTVSNDAMYTKRARVDMEWLYAVIKQLESNLNIRKLLKVHFNDYVYVAGDRLEKPTTTFLQLNTTATELGISIKYTRQVQRVKEIAQTPIEFSDLLADLSVHNPAVSTEKIEAFLNQLFDNEYLLSELRPPIVNTDALEYVIAVLDRIADHQEVNEYLAQLKSIRSAISEYNSSSIGNGTELFEKTVRKMKTLYAAKDYLQVDMKVAMESNMLPDILKLELEEFVDAMIRITPEEQISDDYADYVDRFTEKYGSSAEIPVLELLDTDKGLGIPSYYHGAVRRPIPKQSKSEKLQKLEKLLKRKLILALKEQSGIIELTDQDIDYIAGDRKTNAIHRWTDFLPSFELFLFVHPGNGPSPEKNKYCFTLAPAMASNQVGKSIGRFRDMFSEEEILCFQNQSAELQQMFPDYAIVEIAEIPQKGRTGNVFTNHSDCAYQLMLSTNSCDGKQKISIDDLYISVEPSVRQLHIKSKSLNKRVILVTTSMLNPTIGSSAVRFLKEVSAKHRFNVLDTISSITKSEYEYTPRITYKRIIIKPATWLISQDTLGLHNNTEDNFNQCLQNFREKWNVPRFVYLTQYDNRLLFDLDNPLHIHEIYRFVKNENSRSLQLMELTCNLSEYAAQDCSGRHYATEVVVPFSLSRPDSLLEAENKGRKLEFFPTISDISSNAMEVESQKQILLPGNKNWLYFKLYGYMKRREEILSMLYEFLEAQVHREQIEKYFFIRYSDPEPHLRVRVQTGPDQLAHVFADWIGQLEQMRQKGLISQVVIDSYQRETERYGGTQLIQKAEDYFFSDSRAVMRILHKQHREKISINFEYIGVSLIVMTLFAFGLSMDMTAQFLNASNDRSRYRKEFQKDRMMILHAVNYQDHWKEVRRSIDYPEVYDYLDALSISSMDYAQAVLQADRDGVLTNSIQNIARSIIHMFCNRLMGNNAWERKVYALARHGTHDLKTYLEHMR